MSRILNMKKIAFIINKLSGGGAERVLSILANKFSEDYNVDIITIFSDEVKYNIDENISIIHIKGKSKFKLIRFYQKLRAIRKQIRRNKYDYVISFLYDVNIYTILSLINYNKTKLIVSERNDPFNEPQSKWIRRIRDFLYKKPETIVFQTVEAQQYFDNKIKKHTFVISNPLNPKLQNYNDLIDCDKKNIIIGVGRLEEQKDFKTLIKAFAIFRHSNNNFKLMIYGDGPQKQELIDFVKVLKIEDSVIFSGFIDNIYEEMAKSKIFVLTSKFEGISNALMEAMALGLPSISTDCPIYGSRSLIKHGENGFLVDIGDYEKIAYYLTLLANDNVIYENVSRQSRDIKKTNSVNNIYSIWKEVLYNISIPKNGD